MRDQAEALAHAIDQYLNWQKHQAELKEAKKYQQKNRNKKTEHEEMNHEQQHSNG